MGPPGLAFEARELLWRPAMMRGLFKGSGDPDQDRLAERPAEEIDRDRQLDRLRTDQIACSLAAIGSAHGGAIVDLLGEAGWHRNGGKAAIRAQAPGQRTATIAGPAAPS